MYNGVDLDLPNTNTFDKFLVVDSAGRVHIVSKQLNDKGDIIHRISEDKGATWSDIAVITSGDELRALAADSQGRVHALVQKFVSRVEQRQRLVCAHVVEYRF